MRGPAKHVLATLAASATTSSCRGNVKGPLSETEQRPFFVSASRKVHDDCITEDILFNQIKKRNSCFELTDRDFNSRSCYTNAVPNRIALDIMWANKISPLVMEAIFIATLNFASDAVSLKCRFTAVANFPVKIAIPKRSSIDNKEMKRALS